ncbi:MAG: hypothetical protein ACYDER_29695, partial [Ktedonobacteraceae bacterium]
TFCFVDLLRRHLFLSFYNASPLLSPFFLISPAWGYLVAQLVGYTIYPFSSDYAAAIVTGLIRIHYRLNTNAITQALQDAGFEAECLLGKWRQLGQQQPRKAKPPYFRVQRKGITMSLGNLPIHQMWFEGLRLEDFIKNLETYFDERVWEKYSMTEQASQRRPFHMFATYTDMEVIWASSRNCLLPIHFPEDEMEENEIG